MLLLTPQDCVADAALTATAEHNTTVGFAVLYRAAPVAATVRLRCGSGAAGAREYYGLIIVFWQQISLELQDSFHRTPETVPAVGRPPKPSPRC